ncbi:uncharacterized protein V6R79_018198 [Siganus canaliculatus]
MTGRAAASEPASVSVHVHGEARQCEHHCFQPHPHRSAEVSPTGTDSLWKSRAEQSHFTHTDEGDEAQVEPRTQKPTGTNRNQQEPTETNRNQQKPTGTNRNQQKPTETNRNQQKPTETNRNQQKSTGTNRNQQKPTGTNRNQQKSTGTNRNQQKPTETNRNQQEPTETEREDAAAGTERRAAFKAAVVSRWGGGGVFC